MSSDLKKTRTIRLDSDIDDRLVGLCKHIGTNPNAYLIAEIGKAVSRDEISLRVIDNSAKGQSEFVEKFLSILADKGMDP